MPAGSNRLKWSSAEAAQLVPGLGLELRKALDRALVNREPELELLNVRPDGIDFRDRSYEPRLLTLPVECWPEKTVLRIRDQEHDPTCTGQALAAVIDYMDARRRQSASGTAMPAMVSARMLYELSKDFDKERLDTLGGSSLRAVLKAFFHNGVCSEQTAPYATFRHPWELTVEMAKEARQIALGAYFRLRHILLDYQAAIAEAGAVVVSAVVHGGWERNSVREAGGRIVFDDTSPRLRGGHAFALVGYTAEGFLVQNSEGPKWGGFHGLDGVALWTYRDWQQHVLDGWVLRLAVPAPDTFHMVGGYVDLGSSRPARHRVTTPRIEINGHYINLRNGAFVDRGAYASSLASARETSRFISETDLARNQSERFEHLLIHVDAGLDAFDDATARAALLTPVFKAHKVYPVFLFWNSGLFTRIAELLDSQMTRADERAGGISPLADRLLEEFAHACVRPLWRDAARDAARCALQSRPRQFGRDADLGAEHWPGRGWTGVEQLILAAVARSQSNSPISLNFSAHGPGALLLGWLLRRAALESKKAGNQGEAGRRVGQAATISLLAPACDSRFFRSHYDALARKSLTIYALNAEREAQDRVGPYGRSFLNLASRAFLAQPGTKPAQVIGLAEHKERGVARVLAGEHGARDRCNSRSHLGFSEDPAAWGDILSRITRIGQEAAHSAFARVLTGR